jgi:flagellar motor component MotA
MQIIGLVLLILVVLYGFRDRPTDAISFFDPHALVMVLGGSLACVLISSSSRTVRDTFIAVGELVPGVRRFAKGNVRLEDERARLVNLWREGKRSAASEVAAASTAPAIAKMLELVMSRVRPAVSQSAFTELRHKEIAYWQPVVHNWELLAKLGPALGMVGTISGMVKLFQNMSVADLNIGAAMSLALLSTLYGLAFGVGLAGPISNYLNGLLDERLGCLERCEHSVNELVSRAEL